MDKLILDFDGERLEVPAGFATERSFSQLGMKVEHKGTMYRVVDRHILGVDAVAAEMSDCDEEESIKNRLTMVITLEKI